MPGKFSLGVLKSNPEVAPLIIIMGVAVAGVTAFTTYSLFNKTDVTLNKSKGDRFNYIDVNKPQKFMTINQKYGEDSKVRELKKEILEAYEK
ncbi:UNVERIFIED_CONTAM: hypothetical protein RMT77_001759 [Armadillidium vulgare]